MMGPNMNHDQINNNPVKVLNHQTIVYEDCGWKKFLPLVYMRATFQLRCGMMTLLDRVINQLLTEEQLAKRLSDVGGEYPIAFDDYQFNAVQQDSAQVVADNLRVNDCGVGVRDAADPNAEALHPSTSSVKSNFPVSVDAQSFSPANSLSLWCRTEIAEVVSERTGLNVNQAIQGQPTLLLSGRGIWSSIPDWDDTQSSWVGVVGDGQDVACVAVGSDFDGIIQPQDLLNESRTRMLLHHLPKRDVSTHVQLVKWPWDLVNANAKCLVKDGEQSWLGFGQVDGQVDTGAHLLNESAIHLGDGSRVMPCVVIDAESGPVWIGKNVTVFPNSYIQGPAFIGDGSVLQPGSVVRGGNTLGPVCKVGGEIEGSIIQGYSNKQHDGFLGHSYLGSWINIAADCVNSDLKNTYGSVRVPINGHEVDTGETFVGMFVGDYSKAGINVSFPTGSVVGFCSNVFAPRSPKFIPSFAWINGDECERYDEEKGLQLARKVMARRNRVLTEAEERVFRNVRQQVLAFEHQPQRDLEYVPVAPVPVNRVIPSEVVTPLIRG